MAEPVAGDRILWNRRPSGVTDTGDIDEIVVSDVTVHVEQMDDRCWWIGITKSDGSGDWMGCFTADSRGRMKFVETECNVEWAKDDTHEVEAKV